jgi:type I restriction enzyme R subunit
MGKAMFICIDKITCGRMYQKITHYWQLEIKKLKKQLKTSPINKKPSTENVKLLGWKHYRYGDH